MKPLKLLGYFDFLPKIFCFLFQHINAHHAYESQISSMAKAMSRLEEELRRNENEKAAALNDLSSLRELCIKLDSGKDVMTQQLNSKNLELERVREIALPRCFIELFSDCSTLPFTTQLFVPSKYYFWLQDFNK
jgi:Tfp pilus assembly protein PilO